MSRIPSASSLPSAAPFVGAALPGAVLFAAVLFGAAPASAFSSGQFGYSGEKNSCLACHGTEQGPAIKVTFSGAETAYCQTQDSLFEIPMVPYEGKVQLTVEVAKAEGAAAPACPAESCNATLCTTANSDCEHINNVNGFCANTSNVCGTPLAGFNASISNGLAGAERAPGVGTFEDGEDTRTIENDGDIDGPEGPDTATPDFKEITHRLVKQVGEGPGSWTFSYVAPKLDEAAGGAAAIYIGANTSNSNGLADKGDRNTNVIYAVALKDPTTNAVTVPPFCAACDNGRPLNADGTCPACACTALPSSGGLWGSLALGLVGLVVGTRRRRR